MASDQVVPRLISQLAGDRTRALKAIRAARAAARQRAWTLAGDTAPGTGGGLVTADIDATIVSACSEKDQAAHLEEDLWFPACFAVFADHGPGDQGELQVILRRPGNVGSNTADNHIEATKLALAQVPPGSAARC